MFVDRHRVADGERAPGLDDERADEVLRDLLQGERDDETAEAERTEQRPDPHAQTVQRVHQTDEHDDVAGEPGRDRGCEASPEHATQTRRERSVPPARPVAIAIRMIAAALIQSAPASPPSSRSSIPVSAGGTVVERSMSVNA